MLAVGSVHERGDFWTKRHMRSNFFICVCTNLTAFFVADLP